MVGGARNPGLHWKRRGHRGEEEDTEEDLTKELDDSSAGASVEEGSSSKNGNQPDRKCEWLATSLQSILSPSLHL